MNTFHMTDDGPRFYDESAETAQYETTGDPTLEGADRKIDDPRDQIRLAHCTSVWGHSWACDRDGRYCSRDPFHEGPCKPHGAS